MVYSIDTISAVATAIGEGGIGIVRLSGPQAVTVADKLFIGHKGKRAGEVQSHTVAYGHISDPKTGEVIDEVILIVMRAPRTYTREDVAEIHCHGGPVPLRRILALTLEYGARLAEPGEFTKRAFLNGRLDLAQAEAVIDIIRAKTDASLRMSVGHLSGLLSEKISGLRRRLLGLIAQLEAVIDFPEEDIEDVAAGRVAQETERLLEAVNQLLESAQTGKILRDGLKTVIIGKPNVGKSSLLNALLREKRAIVTDIPGTTRDIIEEYVNIKGVPLKIVDTAGIRETADIVERIGVERAKELVFSADVVLMLLDASSPLTDDDRQILRLLENRQAVVLVNKSDLPPRLDTAELEALTDGKRILKISVLEGTGLDDLEQLIVNLVYAGEVRQTESAYISNVRHINALNQAKIHLDGVLATAAAGMPVDCMVVDLRGAWEKLGEITGETVAEDIIDQIFTQFCIGK